jgi:hypothetical protein
MRRRAAIALVVLVTAAAITVAVVVHQPRIYCSYLGGQPPPLCPQHDYPLSLRLGIAAGGLIVATLIIAVSRVTGYTRDRGRLGSRPSRH